MKALLKSTLLVSITISSLAFAQQEASGTAPTTTPAPTADVPAAIEKPAPPMWSLAFPDLSLDAESRIVVTQDLRLEPPLQRGAVPVLLPSRNIYLNENVRGGKQLNQQFNRDAKETAKSLEKLRADFFKGRMTKAEYDQKSEDIQNGRDESLEKTMTEKPYCVLTEPAGNEKKVQIAAGTTLQFEDAPADVVSLQKTSLSEVFLVPVTEKSADTEEAKKPERRFRIVCPSSTTLQQLVASLAEQLKLQISLKATIPLNAEDGTQIGDKVLSCSQASCSETSKLSPPEATQP